MEFHPLAAQQQAAADSKSVAAPVDAPAAAAVAPLGTWHTHPPHPKRDNQKRLKLTAEQIANYDRDGFLLIKAKDAWTPAELKLILDSVDLMSTWPDKAGAYMKVHTHNTQIHTP